MAADDGAGTVMDMQLLAIQAELEELIRKNDMEPLRRDLIDKPIDCILPHFKSKKYGEGHVYLLAVYYGREDFIKEAISNSHELLDVCLILSEQEPNLNRINLLHLAAMKGHLSIIETILEFYKQPEVAQVASTRPWLAKDSYGATPLHYALMKKNNEQCALAILSDDLYQVWELCNIVDDKGETPFSLAMKNGCDQVVSIIFELFLHSKGILNIHQIFHVIASNNREDLATKAINHLPNQKLCYLLSQRAPLSHNKNPFHVAAKGGHLGMIKLMLDVYRSAEGDPPMPWLAKDWRKKRPLDYALTWDKDECACEILSMNLELCYNLATDDGYDLMSVALENGLKEVASMVLTSNLSYNINRPDGSTALHVIHQRCSELCEELLERQPELIKATDQSTGFSLLHSWLHKGNLVAIRQILETKWSNELLQLIYAKKNPLHIIAESTKLEEDDQSDVEVAQLLIHAYKQERPKASNETSPWLMKNEDGRTPLHLAILNNREKLASYLILVQIGYLDEQTQDGGLFVAVEKGCKEIVEDVMLMISESKSRFGKLLTSANGRNVLHVASNCSEAVGRSLVEQFPEYAAEADNEGNLPLYHASMAGVEWLIKQLLNLTPLWKKNVVEAFIELCKKGHLSAILAFIEYEDFRKTCSRRNCLFLHQLQLKTYKQYKEFLEHPFVGERMNSLDSNNATPLHIALERKDVYYAEALLAAGVKLSFKNNQSQTAVDLLRDRCMEDDEGWISMCQRVGIYKQIVTDFDEVRGTLSTVAALMVNLTFVAAFAFPGGFYEDTGKAILSSRASFTAFILADAYAMCCSMLALFFLTPASKCRYKIRVLRKIIELSSFLVIQSLCGSLVAFASGVYTVIPHNHVPRMWPIFLIFFMCSFVAIIASLFALHEEAVITPSNRRAWVELFKKLKSKFN